MRSLNFLVQTINMVSDKTVICLPLFIHTGTTSHTYMHVYKAICKLITIVLKSKVDIESSIRCIYFCLEANLSIISISVREAFFAFL